MLPQQLALIFLIVIECKNSRIPLCCITTKKVRSRNIRCIEAKQCVKTFNIKENTKSVHFKKVPVISQVMLIN